MHQKLQRQQNSGLKFVFLRAYHTFHLDFRDEYKDQCIVVYDVSLLMEIEHPETSLLGFSACCSFVYIQREKPGFSYCQGHAL